MIVLLIFLVIVSVDDHKSKKLDMSSLKIALQNECSFCLLDSLSKTVAYISEI